MKESSKDGRQSARNDSYRENDNDSLKGNSGVNLRKCDNAKYQNVDNKVNKVSESIHYILLTSASSCYKTTKGSQS